MLSRFLLILLFINITSLCYSASHHDKVVYHDQLDFVIDKESLGDGYIHYSTQIGEANKFKDNILQLDIAKRYNLPSSIMAISKIAVVVKNTGVDFFSDELLNNPQFWSDISQNQRTTKVSPGIFESYVDINFLKIHLSSIPQLMRVKVYSPENIEEQQKVLSKFDWPDDWEKIVYLDGEGMNKNGKLRGSTTLAAIVPFNHTDTLLVSYRLVAVNSSKLNIMLRNLARCYAHNIVSDACLYTAYKIQQLE